jgi:divalent metal cation (Fe/Co/Zn/Cd) transporter
MEQENEIKLYNTAYQLSLFTIIYNMLEGMVSIVLGYNDQTLTLLGFGIDSFIEVISGIGIAVMILRIRSNPDSSINKFEISALKLTGASFYVLSLGLLAGVIINVINKHKPETTFWGIVISLMSIVIMTWLMLRKKSIGRRLNSEPVISDGNCTKICLYMSVILLLSSLVYQLTGFIYADTIGTLGLIYFSFSEGKEAFEKAKTKKYCC